MVFKFSYSLLVICYWGKYLIINILDNWKTLYKIIIKAKIPSG